MYKKNISLRKKIIIPLIILIISQNLIFLLTTIVTGVFDKLDSESYKVLDERARNRSDELNKIINKITTNTHSTSENLALQIQELYKNYSAVDNNIKIITDEIIMAGTEQIIDLTNKENITGVFFILNNFNAGNTYEGVYIRDLSPELTLANNSDLLIEVGPKELSSKLNITLDVQWNSKYNFSKEYNKTNKYFDNSFYIKPYNSALRYKNKNIEDFGYWSKPFKLNSDDNNIITYSVPILINGGRPIGVLGIELSEEFISKSISPRELLYSDSFYVLGEIENGILNTDWFISNGVTAKQVLSKNKEKIEFENINNNNEKMVASIWNVNIYSRDSVHKTNKLALAGVVPEKALQNSSNNLKNTLFISTTMTLVIGIIIIILVSYYITKPIEKLAEQVKQLDPDNQIFFNRTNILEMDYLIDALENLNEGIINSSARMSKIIKAIGLPIGCFEVDWEKDKVFLTDGLFDILEIEKTFLDQKFISLDKWHDITENFLENIVSDLPNCYKWQSNKNYVRWLSMKFINENEKSIGIIIDISEDILRKQQLEYERDHDTLTQLLNRKAFTEKAQEILLNNPNKIGVLLFADLDNLKYINDTYGHSYGDKYIKLAANMFNEFMSFNGIVGRISGDEFVIYLHGYDTKDEALNIINTVLNFTSKVAINLPNNISQKISSSKGIAWYPKDNQSIIELMKYADFAMYEVKKSAKDGLKEFDINSYNKDKR